MPETLPNQELRNRYSKTIRLEGGQVARFFEKVGLSSDRLNELSQAASQSPQHHVAVEGFPGLEMQAPSIENPQVKVMMIDEQVTRARFEAIRDKTVSLEERDVAVTDCFTHELSNQLGILYLPVDKMDMFFEMSQNTELLLGKLDDLFQNNQSFQNINSLINSAVEWVPVAKVVMQQEGQQVYVERFITMESTIEKILEVAEKVKNSLEAFQQQNQDNPGLTMQFRNQATQFSERISDLRQLSLLLAERIKAAEVMETAKVSNTPGDTTTQSSEVDKLTSTVQ